MRILFTIIVLLSLTTTSQATSINYSFWNDTLSAYVDDQGFVDYQGLKKHPEKLNKFIEYIEHVDVSHLNDLERKVFWINAYNALTIKRVVEAYPTNTIRLLDFGLVWKRKRNVAGGQYSLEYIEHEILRPLGDPRIHFAINCASIGCPRLANKPFYPETLDSQLDKETRRFINDITKVRLDRDSNTLYHSEIFSWFKKDFLVVASTIKEYILKYINNSDKAFIEANGPTMNIIPYDWGINDQKT